MRLNKVVRARNWPLWPRSMWLTTSAPTASSATTSWTRHPDLRMDYSGKSARVLAANVVPISAVASNSGGTTSDGTRSIFKLPGLGRGACREPPASPPWRAKLHQTVVLLSLLPLLATSAWRDEPGLQPLLSTPAAHAGSRRCAPPTAPRLRRTRRCSSAWRDGKQSRRHGPHLPVRRQKPAQAT